MHAGGAQDCLVELLAGAAAWRDFWHSGAALVAYAWLCPRITYFSQHPVCQSHVVTAHVPHSGCTHEAPTLLA